MKKIILILLNILLITNVKADEITDNIIIKAKWYKENYDIVFYPKGKELEGYIEVTDIITYGEESEYSSEYCNMKGDYLITYDSEKFYNYYRVSNIKYIKLENITLNDIKKISIYEDMKEIKYTLKEEDNNIMITLEYEIDSSLLWLFIDTEKTYNIKMTRFENFYVTNLTKENVTEKILIPDKTWIAQKAEYSTVGTSKFHKLNDLNILKKEHILCSYREIKTLRYKKEKTYYDDNLHEYVEGYLPDLSTINLKFVGTIPENVKTVTDYIYVPVENTNTEEEKKEEVQEEIIENNCITEPTIKYIENTVYKDKYVTPKYNYYLIGTLLIISIIELLIIIFKKCRLK